MISVSGDVNPEQILKELEARFAGWDASGSDVPWPPPAPEFTPTPGVYHVQKDIPQGRVRIGHLGIQRTDWANPDLFALQVMNDILGGGGFTSRLVQRIRSDEGLAYSAGSRFGIGDWSPGIFMMLYQSKSSTVAFAAQIALEEMKKIATEQVTPAELATAKASFVDTFPGRFDSVGVIVGTLLDDEYMGRPGDFWKKYQSRMAAVSVEDVQRVAKKYLHPDNLVFLIVGNWEDIVPGDADGRASMKEFHDGQSIALPLRDPLTLEPIK
jgi:predicted Zn-dependent peptidase